MISIFQHFFQSRVGNQVPQGRLTHSLDIAVSISSLNIFVASEGSIFISKDRPEGKALNLDSLHFLGDVIGSELNLLNLGGKLDVAVSKSKEDFETNSCLDEFALPDNKQPFIRLRFYESLLKEYGKTCPSNDEAAKSPDILWWVEEDGLEEAVGNAVYSLDLFTQELTYGHKICYKIKRICFQELSYRPTIDNPKTFRRNVYQSFAFGDQAGGHGWNQRK